MSTILVAVVAMASNHVIGDGDDLLWHLPGDLKRVKQLTMGCPLIMGRKTWDSIGRPLPGRLSIVLTRDKNWKADGAVVASSLEDAMAKGASWLAEQGTGERRQILFGGGQIYSLGLDLCDMIEMTEVDLAPEDVTKELAKFPVIDAVQWQEVARQEVAAAGDVPAHRFISYNKR